MSRRAIQGYTEKSYYENTKYSGLIATGDPLNEGYFKHLVNFDIADTGMSVKPRKGYLTTTLRHNDEQKTLINLSTNTIMFKEHSVQEYIIYDFDNNKGYIADVSEYNIDEKLLPVTNTVSILNWDEVVTYLKNNIPEINTYAQSVSYSALISYIQQHLLHDTTNKIEHIIDINGVRKTLIKVAIEDTIDDASSVFEKHEFILAIYYRRDAVTTVTPNLPANTLVFEVLDMNVQHSYDMSVRNIASNKSIIPANMQTLYNLTPGDPLERPDGHISNVGMIYVRNPDKDYMLQHVYKSEKYTLLPYFDLNPAAYHENLEVEADAKWAYRFDVVSTNDNSKISKGSWFTYNGKNNFPTHIFPTPTDSVIYGDYEEVHYKGTKYVITVIPLSTDFASTRDYDQGDGSYSNVPTDWSTYKTRYESWYATLENVNDKESFIKAMEDFDFLVRFDVRDLRGDIDLLYSPVSDNADYNRDSSDVSYSSDFKTKQDILDLIEQGFFTEYNITFRLLPISVKLTTYYPGAEDTYQFEFCELNYFEVVKDTYDFMLEKYDKHGDVKEKFNWHFYENDEYIVGIDTDTLQTRLDDADYFKNGYSVIMYMRPYIPAELVNMAFHAREQLKSAWTVSAFTSTRQVVYGYDDLTVTKYVEYQKDDPANIQNADNMIMFRDSYLVVWKDNNVYISEQGVHNYFKAEAHKSFSEPVVKVLEYKNILLVFTTQHLYAIYEASLDKTVMDAEGNPTVQSTLYWASQRVLYNILTSRKYADAIQVFNEMVLFYSEEGQLFMIKPSTMINDETRFSLKYFNKAANDILVNYDTYINERLFNYNIDYRVTKEEVQIKSLISVNYIKIFYYVPGYITYILIYDVLNNRYYAYDTLTFHNIKDKLYIDSGELYITTDNQSTYLTIPYTESNKQDSNVDMSITNDFKKIAISSLIDTGNMNLNNHLKKRFRDLHVIFKNINSSKLLFNVESVLDDIVSHPYYNTQLEVQDIGGVSYFMTVPKSNNNDLIELIDITQVSDAATNAFTYALEQGLFENNILLDFSGYTSSKLLTHKTSVLGMGKVFRLKLQFISKGVFKIQSFGVVYKERRV